MQRKIHLALLCVYPAYILHASSCLMEEKYTPPISFSLYRAVLCVIVGSAMNKVQWS